MFSMSILTICLLTGGLLVIIYTARYRLLRAVGSFLISNDREYENCDAIVLMNGNISTRPFRAAELHKKYRAPILIARLADTEEVRLGVIPNISEATRDLLFRLNVAPSDIHLLRSEHWIAGTWSEAILHCDYIRANNCRKIIIVTDAFHTRRAHWAFRKVMQNDDVVFRAAATRYSLDLAGRWWRSEYGLVQLVVEYLKFLHYRRLGRSAKHKPAPVESDLPLAGDVRPIVHGQSDPK